MVVSSFFNRMKLQTKLTLLIGVLFIVPLLFVRVYISRFMTDEYYAAYGERAMNVARFVASSPRVVAALANPGSVSFAELGSYLDALGEVAQVRYIVPMNMNGKRLYHPDREKIGQPFAGGDEARALRGESYVSSAVGTLGFSQRAFAPVLDSGGRQIGAVAVGIMSDAIEGIIAKLSLPLRNALSISMVIGLVLVALLARSIKKILFGLEPVEMATLLQERDAMLHLVREGVVAVNLDGRVTLVNDEARRILQKAGIDGPRPGDPLADFAPVRGLFAAPESGAAETDSERNINGVTVLANHMPLAINSRPAGAIATFRDMSEVRQLAERITDINRYADALRSQSHEFLNKLHVIMGLLNGGKLEELRAYIGQLADARSREDKVIHDAVKDPVIAGFLSSKYSSARERGVAIFFGMRGVLPLLRGALRNGLVTVLGNLVDNGLDALENSREKRLNVGFSVDADTLRISIADTGRGMDEDTLSRIFSKGWSTKGENRGLGLWLVRKTVDVLGGSIEVDSRPGAGTVFHVTLPLRDGGEGSPRAAFFLHDGPEDSPC